MSFDWKQNTPEIMASTYAEIAGFSVEAKATADDNAKQKGNLT